VAKTSAQNPYDTTHQFQQWQPTQMTPTDVSQFFLSNKGSTAFATSALPPLAQASGETAAAGLYGTVAGTLGSGVRECCGASGVVCYRRT
jgi:hypothetical protein